jgi:hypothetical protein
MGKFKYLLYVLAGFCFAATFTFILDLYDTKMYRDAVWGSFLIGVVVFFEYKISKLEHSRVVRYKTMNLFLQYLDKEDIVKGLQNATIAFQTVAVKHNELVMLYEENRTPIEQKQIDIEKKKKDIAEKKYVLIRSMIASHRDDLAWGAKEQWDTFLPQNWIKERHS